MYVHVFSVSVYSSLYLTTNTNVTEVLNVHMNEIYEKLTTIK